MTRLAIGAVAVLLAATPAIASEPVLGSGAGTTTGATGSATLLLGQTVAGTAASGAGSAQLGFWPAFRYRGVVPVHLASFEAAWESGGVVLRWRVAAASHDHAGFHVHRAAGDGPRSRLTDRLLSGRTAYDWRDPAPPAGRASYWLAEHDRAGGVSWHGPLEIAVRAGAPALALLQNAPNPVAARTTIAFQLPAAGHARLRVYDAAGRLVAPLLDDVLGAGTYEVDWAGRDESGTRLAAGVYFYRLETPHGERVRKLILVGG